MSWSDREALWARGFHTMYQLVVSFFTFFAFAYLISLWSVIQTAP